MRRLVRELFAPSDSVRLFLVSALVLFLEILFIRWLSAEVALFTYLRNLALLVAFFGLGAGCLASRRPTWPPLSAVCLLAVVLLVLDPLGLKLVPLKSADQALMWRGSGPLPVGQLVSALFSTLLSCGLMAGVFFPLGQLMGRWMDEHPQPIVAYSLNGLGGLAGIWLFQALSQLWIPPEGWFACAFPLMLGAMRGNLQRLLATFCLVLVVLAAAFSPRLVASGGDPEGFNLEGVDYIEAPPDYRVLWSPYHKIGISERFVFEPATEQSVSTGHMFRLADIKFQRVVRLAPEFVQAHPEVYDPESVARSDYNFPYRFGLDPPDSVLVAGAGCGNDVAAALRAGARRVVAVEIDPAFVELGRQFHPEKPYDDPRVEVVIDDARAFFRRCEERFDLVVFGHLSSQPRGNELQLMSYFYTRESFQEARRLLKPGRSYLVGSINWSQIPQVRLRVRQMLADAFGTPPLFYENAVVADHIGNSGLCYVEAEPDFMRELASRLPPNLDWRADQVDPTIGARVPPMTGPSSSSAGPGFPRSIPGCSGLPGC